MAAETFPSLDRPQWPARLARASLWIIGAGLIVAVLAGPLHRLGFASPQIALLTLATGFVVLSLGALLAIGGLVAALACATPIPRGATVLALVVALAVVGYLLSWVAQARAVPPIHDVSTDLESPPEFVAVREIRNRLQDVNPPEYSRQVPGPGGTMLDVPVLQRQGYPDIRPLELPVSPDGTLARARQVAETLGWEIVAVDPSEGRLEATDTTAFFGFKDDIVVRVTAIDGGSRVDVRSKSRVGLNDMGANAKRIREFMKLMQND